MPAASTVLFPGDATYRVNIGILDTQHKNLVSMVNELHQAMGSDKRYSPFLNAKGVH
jgi:hemerythrin